MCGLSDPQPTGLASAIRGTYCMSAVTKAFSHATDVDADHLPVLSPSELQTEQINNLFL